VITHSEQRGAHSLGGTSPQGEQGVTVDLARHGRPRPVSVSRRPNTHRVSRLLRLGFVASSARSGRKRGADGSLRLLPDAAARSEPLRAQPRAEVRYLALDHPDRVVAVHRTDAGVPVFTGDIVRPPRAWLERAANVVRLTEPERGGHFAPFEEPELYSQELRAFSRPYRAAAVI